MCVVAVFQTPNTFYTFRHSAAVVLDSVFGEENAISNENCCENHENDCTVLHIAKGAHGISNPISRKAYILSQNQSRCMYSVHNRTEKNELHRAQH